MDKISVMTFNSFPRQNDMVFKLFISDCNEGIDLKLIKSVSNTMMNIFELEMPSPFEFGKAYSLILTDNVSTPIDVSDAVSFPEFDEMFNYDGDDLGAIYSKNKTDFALWAPLADRVILKLQDEKGVFHHHNLHRTDKGVYRLTVEGDILNRLYSYVVVNSGSIRESTDPYGFGTGLNSKYSAVVDLKAIKEMGKVPLKSELKNYVDHIIYEVGVRDFTEQNGDATDIVNKGKYLGFVEKGRKTKGGHPAGLDYLINLGITTVQLNPIIDFGSVPDDRVNEKYNWGYDPINMFSIEGSYSLHPENPMERLIEFKTLVNELHKADIRVVLDVVYNHIYDYMASCYEKVVPDYYFRRSRSGNIANASGCGDDFASEKFMCRKMIIDSLKYFIDIFDIDGYRFDLMGLLDITTLTNGYSECKKIKENLIFYGEGWNMGAELSFEEKGCSENAFKLPFYGFFNETVRDVVKGQTFNLGSKGYISGDLQYAYGLKYIVYGCACDVSYNAKFLNANQSLNYIECHDNHTLFDKLKASNSEDEQDELLRRVGLGNGIVLTIFGIPFLHMGQEIGLSKQGNGNSYNVLDINKMDYRLVDERWEMVNYVKGLCRLRKEFKVFHLTDPDDLLKGFTIIEDKNVFFLSCTNPEWNNGNKELVIAFNANPTSVPFELDDEYKMLLSKSGYVDFETHLRNVIIPPLVCTVFIK